MTFPGYKNEEYGFISVPSMFGGTKLVPKVPSSQSSNKGRSSGQCAAGRMAFSNEQIEVLEEAFQRTQYPDSHLKLSLAHRVDQPVSRVQVVLFTLHRRDLKVCSCRIGSETGEPRRRCWIIGWWK